MSATPTEYVFGYGSLAAGEACATTRLRGHRRVWGVAMDNRVAIAGYKRYRRPRDGSHPPVHVAFLDLVAEPGAVTAGVLLAVDAARLEALDRRERNYERIDVTAAVDDPPGRVWTYRGATPARERLRAGRRAASAVIVRSYLDAVRAGLAAHAVEDHVELDGLPVVELERVDLPVVGYGAAPSA